VCEYWDMGVVNFMNYVYQKNIDQIKVFYPYHVFISPVVSRWIHHIQYYSLLPGKNNTLLTIPLHIGEKHSDHIMSIDAIPEFSDHELETILFVGHDITEAKRIEQELHFSGAHRSLYLLRNRKLTEYKGDRKPIGGIPNKKRPEENFTNHLIKYKPGDKVFFFTDGLPDQLGGPENKKYTPGRIRNMITENPGFTMTQYHNHFMQDFEEWMSDAKQIDDVLIIGIEF
jgi:serine phosphatase RsbU (regulator of sigma subunit)